MNLGKEKDSYFNVWLKLQKWCFWPIGIVYTVTLFVLNVVLGWSINFTYWIVAATLLLFGAGSMFISADDDLKKRTATTLDFLRQTLLVLFFVTVALVIISFYFSGFELSDLTAQDKLKSIHATLKDSSEIIAATIGAAIAFAGALVAINLANQGLLASKEQQNARLQTFFDKLVEQSRQNINVLERALIDFRANATSTYEEFKKSVDEKNRAQAEVTNTNDYDQFCQVMYAPDVRIRDSLNYFHTSLVASLGQLTNAFHDIGNDPIISFAWGNRFYDPAQINDPSENIRKLEYIRKVSLPWSVISKESNLSELGEHRRSQFTSTLIRLSATLNARTNRFNAVSQQTLHQNQNRKVREEDYKLVHKSSIHAYLEEISKVLEEEGFSGEVLNELPSILIMGYYMSPSSESEAALTTLGIKESLENLRTTMKGEREDSNFNLGFVILVKLLMSFPDSLEDFKNALRSEFEKIAGLSHTRIEDLVKHNSQQLLVLGQAIKDIKAEAEKVMTLLLSNLEFDESESKLIAKDCRLCSLLDFDDSRHRMSGSKPHDESDDSRGSKPHDESPDASGKGKQ